MSIRKKGSDIAGSPFKIEVAAVDVGDASMVMVRGRGCQNGYREGRGEKETEPYKDHRVPR